jgi:outer membrane murein-binding lipoprotein Lpp
MTTLAANVTALNTKVATLATKSSAYETAVLACQAVLTEHDDATRPGEGC